MTRSIIVEAGTRAVFPIIVLFSLYLLFAGHNAPGGGFVGGLVAGAALVLVYVAVGSDELRRVSRVPPESLLGVGVLFAAVTGVAGLWRGDFLESAFVELPLPVLGTVKASSVLVFDIGVYFVVVGLVLAVLESLGGEMDYQ